MNWSKVFVYLHRTSTILILGFFLFVAAQLIFDFWYRSNSDLVESENSAWGGKRPFFGETIKTREGSLLKILRSGDEYKDRELGGITIANPSNGKSVALAPGADEVVVNFEILSNQIGGDSWAFGYLATVASDKQYRAGMMDLIVGTFPEMTRHVVAKNVRIADLPTVRGDGSIGLLMWTEDNLVQLVAIRLSDGAIVESNSVKLPALHENSISQGPRNDSSAAGAAVPHNEFD